jgi:hypothetical protein
MAALTILFLLSTSLFLLSKEKTIESTLKTTRITTSRQFIAVGAVELLLLSVNVIAAKRIIRITQAWRAARIGDVIMKGRAAIDVIAHPPPVLRAFMAPFQLLRKHTVPLRSKLGLVHSFVKRKAASAALRYEKKRMLFDVNLVAQTERVLNGVT